MKRAIQLLPDLVFGDAVSNDCLFLDGVLRRAGYETEIAVERADERYHGRVKRFANDAPASSGATSEADRRRVERRTIPPRALRPDEIGPEDLLIFHFSTWSETAGWLLAERPPRLVLIYHNVTPPEFFGAANLRAAERNQTALDRLPEFAPWVQLAIAKSEFSERELRTLGFARTAVVPLAVELDPSARYSERAFRDWRKPQPVMLSVGRIAPNKRIEDLIHILAAYRARIGDAWLLLVGAQDIAPGYRMWLSDLVGYLGLEGRVAFAGHVSREDLLGYYRAADVYLCMSEHEGFCVPLIEAMALGLPVISFASSAIPATMGDAGILLQRKDPLIAAEIVDQAIRNRSLRERLLAAGRRRAAELAPKHVAARFLAELAHVDAPMVRAG